MSAIATTEQDIVESVKEELAEKFKIQLNTSFDGLVKRLAKNIPQKGKTSLGLTKKLPNISNFIKELVPKRVESIWEALLANVGSNENLSVETIKLPFSQIKLRSNPQTPSSVPTSNISSTKENLPIEASAKPAKSPFNETEVRSNPQTPSSVPTSNISSTKENLPIEASAKPAKPLFNQTEIHPNTQTSFSVPTSNISSTKENLLKNTSKENLPAEPAKPFLNQTEIRPNPQKSSLVSNNINSLIKEQNIKSVYPNTFIGSTTFPKNNVFLEKTINKAQKAIDYQKDLQEIPTYSQPNVEYPKTIPKNVATVANQVSSPITPELASSVKDSALQKKGIIPSGFKKLQKIIDFDLKDQKIDDYEFNLKQGANKNPANGNYTNNFLKKISSKFNFSEEEKQTPSKLIDKKLNSLLSLFKTKGNVAKKTNDQNSISTEIGDINNNFDPAKKLNKTNSLLASSFSETKENNLSSKIKSEAANKEAEGKATNSLINIVLKPLLETFKNFEKVLTSAKVPFKTNASPSVLQQTYNKPTNFTNFRQTDLQSNTLESSQNSLLPVEPISEKPKFTKEQTKDIERPTKEIPLEPSILQSVSDKEKPVVVKEQIKEVEKPIKAPVEPSILQSVSKDSKEAPVVVKEVEKPIKASVEPIKAPVEPSILQSVSKDSKEAPEGVKEQVKEVEKPIKAPAEPSILQSVSKDSKDSKEASVVVKEQVKEVEKPIKAPVEPSILQSVSKDSKEAPVVVKEVEKPIKAPVEPSILQSVSKDSKEAPVVVKEVEKPIKAPVEPIKAPAEPSILQSVSDKEKPVVVKEQVKEVEKPIKAPVEPIKAPAEPSILQSVSKDSEKAPVVVKEVEKPIKAPAEPSILQSVSDKEKPKGVKEQVKETESLKSKTDLPTAKQTEKTNLIRETQKLKELTQNNNSVFSIIDKQLPSKKEEPQSSKEFPFTGLLNGLTKLLKPSEQTTNLQAKKDKDSSIESSSNITPNKNEKKSLLEDTKEPTPFLFAGFTDKGLSDMKEKLPDILKPLLEKLSGSVTVNQQKDSGLGLGPGIIKGALQMLAGIGGLLVSLHGMFTSEWYKGLEKLIGRGLMDFSGFTKRIDGFIKGFTTKLVKLPLKIISNFGKGLTEVFGKLKSVTKFVGLSGVTEKIQKISSNIVSKLIGIPKKLISGFGKSIMGMFSGGMGLGGTILGKGLGAVKGFIPKLLGGLLAGVKKLPIVGTLISIGFAWDRFNKGDYLGGGLDLLSSVAKMVPGVGTALSWAVDGLNAFLDFKAGGIGEGKKGKGAMLMDWAKSFGSWAKEKILGFPIIGPFIKATKDFVGDPLGSLKNLALAIPGVESIVGFFDSPVENTKKAIGAVGNWIGQFGSWVWEKIQKMPILGPIIKGVNNLFSGNIIEGLQDLAKATPIGALVSFLANTETGQALGEKAKGMVGSIGSFIGGIKDKVLRKILEFLPESILGVSVRSRVADMLGIDMGPVVDESNGPVMAAPSSQSKVSDENQKVPTQADTAITASKDKTVKPVGDAQIDPSGGLIVSSAKEGALYQLSKNDSVIAAPKQQNTNPQLETARASTGKMESILEKIANNTGATNSNIANLITGFNSMAKALKTVGEAVGEKINIPPVVVKQAQEQPTVRATEYAKMGNTEISEARNLFESLRPQPT